MGETVRAGKPAEATLLVYGKEVLLKSGAAYEIGPPPRNTPSRNTGRSVLDRFTSIAGGQRAGTALDLVWRAIFLSELANDASPSVRVEMRLVPVKIRLTDGRRLEPDGILGDRTDVRNENGEYTLHVGDAVMVEVRNEGSRPVYLSLIDIDGGGTISHIFPGAGEAPTFLPLKQASGWQRMPYPYAFVINEPAGREVFKLIATARETDITPLDSRSSAAKPEVDAGEKRPGENALAYLLRTTGVPSATTGDWNTATVKFKVLAVPRIR